MQWRFGPTVLLWTVWWCSGRVGADPTWPSPVDELEDVMYLSTGYRSRGFASNVTPCSKGVAPGRNTAAEWLRTGFHDMANANVFFAPHGGLDASLAFELNTGDNLGTGFNTAFITYAEYLNSRLSAADLVALGTYASVRACGGPVIAVKGGRKDATQAGSAGATPQPQNAIGIFNNQFSRMGFTSKEMIQMVACGHTLGGVHASNFPNIVAPGTAPNDYGLFDNSLEFDNAIASRYINGPDTDPLSVGISVKNTRNSDKVVFNSDGNVTVRAMTDPATFSSVCASILGRMIDTVDPDLVTLSAPVTPYLVKPMGLQLTLLSGGTLLRFSGDIRVRTTTRSASQIASVQLAYNDRTGAAVSSPIIAAAGGTAAGMDDSFSFYAFSSNLPVATSISSFKVLVNLVGGTTETYDNNGVGYPVSDSVVVLTPQSCYSGGNLTVVAAVRNTVATAPTMTVTQKVKVVGGSPIPSPLPNLVNSSVAMVQGASYGPYKLYSGSTTIAAASGTKYGAVSGTYEDTFKDVSELGATCQPLGTTVPSSTSTTVSSTSTTTSTSASASATLGIQPIIGAYSFQGCYTEATGVRALTGAAYFDAANMTLDKCAASCTGFTYWGVEYGQECYCGNSLNAGSVLAAAGDCNFVCPGSPVQYCGAGNRLELYKLTSSVTTTSASSSATTASSSSSLSSSTSSTLSRTSSSTSSSARSSSSSSTSGVTSSSSTSVSSSTASSQTAVPTLRIVRSAGLYNYHGCYTEGNGVRALGAASFPKDTNTIESCVAACSPYLYAGAEYGRECWCANSFGVGSTLVPDSECSMTCAGDQYEYCGAGNRLTVYIRNGTTGSSLPSSSSSVLVPNSSSSKSSTSTSTSVTTSSVSSVLSSTSLTSSKASSSSSSTSPSASRSSTSTISSIGLSTTLVSSTKSSTASLSSTSSAVASTSSSSSTSSIVGPLSITSSSRTITSSTPSTTTATPTPAIKLEVSGNWTFFGCQTEATNTRALSGAAYFSTEAMDLELCAASCVGWKYFGTEYGRECYCGNVLNTGSTSVVESECSFLCPGDATEYCGAGNRLSVYAAK